MNLPNRYRRLRRGFSLLEIMIALFIMSLGLVMIAASFPVALRQSQENQDLMISSLVARIGAAAVNQFGNRGLLPHYTDPVPAPTSCYPADNTQPDTLFWYGPATDIFGNGTWAAGVYTPGTGPRWFNSNNPPGWGQAIPLPSDARYAYQIFYTRTLPVGAAATGPYVYNVSVVVQSRVEGAFQPPCDRTQLAQLAFGDLCCIQDPAVNTRSWRWQRFPGAGVVVPAQFGFGIRGSVGVFETVLMF